MNQVINILILTKADLNRLTSCNDKKIKECIDIVGSALEVIYLHERDKKNTEKELLSIIKNDITKDETFEYGRENLINLISELIMIADQKRLHKNK